MKVMLLAMPLFTWLTYHIRNGITSCETFFSKNYGLLINSHFWRQTFKN